MTKSVIVFGSSRSHGDTYDAIKLIINKIKKPLLIDLAEHTVSDFDYEHKNKNDDFMKIIEKIMPHDLLILATPIYWYTISASMKRFVDRLSDLLSTNIDHGRLLRGKNLAIISSYSVYPEGKNGFEDIFIHTAKYLGINYLGCYFHYAGEDANILAMNNDLANQFVAQLNKNPITLLE